MHTLCAGPPKWVGSRQGHAGEDQAYVRGGDINAVPAFLSDVWLAAQALHCPQCKVCGNDPMRLCDSFASAPLDCTTAPLMSQFNLFNGDSKLALAVQLR
ncbi:unnamed protein product [Caretta caretta]